MRQYGEQVGKFACCILGQGTQRNVSTFEWLDKSGSLTRRPNRLLRCLLVASLPANSPNYLTIQTSCTEFVNAKLCFFGMTRWENRN